MQDDPRISPPPDDDAPVIEEAEWEPINKRRG